MKTPKRIEHPAEYETFIQWFGTPEPFREPKTAQELAVILGVANSTLSAWKDVDDFFSRVQKATKKWMRTKTPNMISALYHGGLRKKQAAEIKLWLQYAEDFSEKRSLDEDGMEAVWALERAMRAAFEKKK